MKGMVCRRALVRSKVEQRMIEPCRLVRVRRGLVRIWVVHNHSFGLCMMERMTKSTRQ